MKLRSRRVTPLVLFGLLASILPAMAQPPAPLAPILTRLDTAPIRWQSWDKPVKAADDVSRATANVSEITRTMRPLVESAIASPVLQRIGTYPVVGGAANQVAGALQLLVTLDKGLATVVVVDRKHNAPLRAAILAGAKLQRTRSVEDAPAVASSFADASRVLEGDEAILRLQSQRLAMLDNSLTFLMPMLEQYIPANSKRAVNATTIREKIRLAKTLLDRRAGELDTIGRWLEDGSKEALVAE